ncbi:MAG TPA: ribonuclease Z [Mycobacteriales bacterium]|nr:ribonuclease Z [Mycobacteriales bacterium]
MITVTLLGTGSPLPDPLRAGPATLITAGETRLLVDAGRGVLMRAAAAGVAAGQLDAVLLTHLHSDHVTDLADLITTRWVTSLEPNPLRVVGPVGTKRMVEALLDSLAADIGYRLAHHADLTWQPPVEVREVTVGACFESAGVTVHTAPTDHRPVEPSIGFRVEYDGRSVVAAGDTVPCASLDELCAGADALVHTVIRKDVVAQIPLQRFQDIADYHSSVEEAAQTAARAGVTTLILTHYVPALVPGSEAEWRELAARHFTGRVELGDDLLRIEVTG